MRWPSLFICCRGDQLSLAGKYLSSCHSENSPQTGRGNPHFLAVDTQVPSSEWERQRVCCCVNSLFRRNLGYSSCTPGRKCRNLGFCWLFCLLFQLLGKVGRRRHVSYANVLLAESHPPEAIGKVTRRRQSEKAAVPSQPKGSPETSGLRTPFFLAYHSYQCSSFL